MRNRWLVTGSSLFAVILFSAVLLLPAARVAASFSANDLIDDYTFENAASMTAAQIDAFLNAFPNSCISQSNGFQAPDPTGYSPSTGFAYGNNVSAGAVISHAAQAYGINPEVLITTLEKESSVVTGNASYHCQYLSTAMGYDCPDAGNCPQNPATESGFSKQLIHAAWLFRFGEQRSEGNVNWSIVQGSWDNSDDPHTCYGGPMTQGYRARIPQQNATSDCPYNLTYYDGYTTIDNTSVHMDTGATAALYWYTPHFQGNQSFVSIFESWFGPTTSAGFQKVISDDPNDPRQWVVYGSIKQYVPDSQTIYAWGLQNVPLTTMSASALASISTGPNLARLMRSNTNPRVLYFLDSGKRYAVMDNNLLNTWGISGMVTSYVSPGLFNLPSDGGYLSYDVQPVGSTTIYMTDGLGTNSQPILRPFASDAVFRAWEGDAAFYTQISTDLFNTMDTDVGSTLSITKVAYGGNEYQVVNGSRLSQPLPYAYYYPGVAQSISGATFARLQNGGQVTHMIRASNDPTVYMIDNGQKHAVASTSVLNAWLPSGTSVTLVNSNYVSVIPTGAPLSVYAGSVNGTLYVVMNGTKLVPPGNVTTAYQAALNPISLSAHLLDIFHTGTTPLTSFLRGVDEAPVYLLDNSGVKHHLISGDMANLYGAYSSGITVVPDNMVDNITAGADSQPFVSDGTTEYMVEGGVKHPISGSVLTDWGVSNPQTYSDGTLSLLPTGAAMDSKLRDGNNYFLIKNGQAFLTTDVNIAQVWAIDDAAQMNSALIRTQLSYYMLTRFIHSTDPNDTNTYIVDKGQWYTVSPTQLANLGGNGAPIMGLTASVAPNTITAWNDVVVQDSAGVYYVIDGGTKRHLPSGMIKDQWTNFETLNVPTMSNGFLNLLPTTTNMERTIKGSAPAVYTVWGATKQHILYPSTYATYYAPYTNVSDSLLNAMPTGNDI